MVVKLSGREVPVSVFLTPVAELFIVVHFAPISVSGGLGVC